MARKKRPDGSGSIEERDRDWLVSLQHQGKRYYKTTATRKEAEIALGTLRAELNKPKVKKGAARRRVKSVVADWIASKDYREGPSMKAARHFQRLVEPLEDEIAATLTPEAIEDWLGSLKVAPSSQRRALGLVRSALDLVFERGNPAQHIHIYTD